MPTLLHLRRGVPIAALAFATFATPVATAAPVPTATRQLLLDTQRVGPAVLETLDSSPRARVLVAYTVEVPDDELGMRSKQARRALATTRDSVLAGLDAAEVDVTHRYETINAFAASVSLDGLAALLGHPAVAHVEVDIAGSGAMTQGIPLTNVDAVHTLGNTGVGMKVVVLDSGLDSDHLDFTGALVDEECFCQWHDVFDQTPCCPGGLATESGPGSAEDDLGHGTHVTGILAGDGSIAPVGGVPDASIVAVKVLSDQNFGLVSDWIAGLEWVATNHPDADVVNLSLGTPISHSSDCDGMNATYIAMGTAIDNLRSNGTLTFAASHNQGFASGISFPACLSNVISVGATYDADVGSQSFPVSGGSCLDSTTEALQVTCFTNSGPPLDLMAPGANTLSSYIGGGTSSLAGTSMATPLVASCGALLLERTPAASLAEVQAALTGSPVTVVDAKNGLTFPFLDCEASAALLDGCLPTPRPDCKEAGASSLSWKDNVNDAKDSLVWRWKKGPALTQVDFDDPTGESRYQICAYPGGIDPIATAPIPAGTTNWTPLPLRGYRYTDKNGPASGITKIQLVGGTDGKSRILLKAKGAGVPSLALPATVPFTIQLVNRETNECFGSTFGLDDIRKNGATGFKGVAK